MVLLDSARSAELPHSSGILGAIAPSTFPEAARVAMPLGSADQLGSASSSQGSAHLDQPLVQLCVRDWPRPTCHMPAATPAEPAPRARSAGECGDHFIGNLEVLFRVEAQHLFGSGDFLFTQRGAVCLASALRSGAGQPMISGKQIKLGRSVTALAASRASASAATFSW